ncbi:hypothetical protein EBL_c07270 [Shimwellia blattae DSM 4481 = NBRC 105725]|uniref:Uncharacterized protein n=1 Tax=Shimwellia blattae (strain ATCC 29907 / DSM 4481 / JCM 1650 / NBRC 105725 / CDC 9005-74) TaxID=630626 RepID=I2B5P6_SHIBC|nr:hypothetical protein EBL_c07270 [Shimwellia blattae DSM 4481 = NBRC 105725]
MRILITRDNGEYMPARHCVALITGPGRGELTCRLSHVFYPGETVIAITQNDVTKRRYFPCDLAREITGFSPVAGGCGDFYLPRRQA